MSSAVFCNLQVQIPISSVPFLPQHPFVSSVTDCRPLRELIAEAKAEVWEEIEDSKEEEEEEEEPETPVVATYTGALFQRALIGHFLAAR